ncbi:transcription factor Rba50 [Apiospora marii]|uniref:Transcription factor Rba50 n=1 Tax=Apiospora marii TaxID=335849 RepID=A0ABR1R7H2_9PEZI
MADSQQTKPTILLLSLENEDETEGRFGDPDDTFFREAIHMLLERAHIKRATSLGQAIKYLNHNRPDGILVTDTEVINEWNRELLGRIISFAQYGGTVVFSFDFADNLRWFDEEALVSFWQESWGLPWKVKECSASLDLQLNMFALTTPHAPGSNKIDLDDNETMLLPQYTTYAIHYMNVPKENCWYYHTEERRSVRELYRSDPDRVDDQVKTAVATSRVGDGYVGFVSDYHGCMGTNHAILRMFNLPREKRAMENI